jgi:hypothetical protein
MFVQLLPFEFCDVARTATKGGLSQREGRGVAFLGEIALLASPRSTQAGP